MSRLFDDGASDFAQISSTPVTAAPLTLACWFYSDDATVNQDLIGLYDASEPDQYFRLVAAGARAGDPLRAWTHAGAAAQADSTSGYSANTWHHGCATFTSSASRACYIDGGSKGTNVVDKTPAGISRISVGRMGDSTPGDYMSGRVAWASLWNVALFDAEVAALASGVLPWRIRAANLKACYPLWGLDSPEVDLVSNGYPLTLSGTARADDPPVAPFSMRMRGQTPYRFMPYPRPRGRRGGMLELVGGMN